MLMPYGPANARILVVLDCVSYRDLQRKTILDDWEFDRMLNEAGGSRAECFITALIREETRGQDFDLLVAQKKMDITPKHRSLHDRMVLPLVLTSLERLEADIDLIKPKIILTLGNGPLFVLTGKWGTKSWRSSILPYTSPKGHQCHVVPTSTPGYVNSVWKDRQTVVHDIRKAITLARRDEPIEPPAYNFLIEPDFSTTAGCLSGLLRDAEKASLKLSVDIETRGGHIACTGIAWSAVDSICIPHLRAVHPDIPGWETRINYWREEEESYLLFQLYKLLTHPNVEVIGQNFLYDAQYFYRWFHFIPRFVRDTMITQHCMFNTMPKGLDFLSAMWCEHHVYWKDESKNWSPKLGERQLWSYNCMDCVRTYEIDTNQQLAIDSWASWPELRSVHDFQQSLFYPVLQTMNRGILPDAEATTRISAELADAIAEREAWLTAAIGHPLNPKSPKQMSDFFYRELDQKKVLKRGTISPTCDDAALEKIASREPLLLPVVSRISELRSLGVFKSTFIDAELDIDERIRCSFNIAGTKSYRFSSSQNAFGSGLNLQNIPTGDEDAEASTAALPNVRKNFIPDPGFVFFDIDLDSADLRIVVEEADIPAMREWLADGKKPYVEVAKEYYKDPSITKSHPAYKFFKAFCHATHYMGTPSGMADAVNNNLRVVGLPSMTVTELQKLQDWYFGMFPELKTWHEKIEHQVVERHYVENAFGYRFHFFDRITKDVLNEAVALIPQSTVACVINRGYKNLHDNHPEIEVLLQVHDSLGGQFPEGLSNGVDIIRESCSIVVPYKNPLVIPVGIKTSALSWGHCE